MSSTSPRVSIGVPVYNGAASLVAMLDSLLRQTFTDFEIIISDNASMDDTALICHRYAAHDARIRYFLQPTNIGPERNFKFALDQARAPYFMWSSCDDIRSPEFLEENVRFLNVNRSYVASMCPNRFEKEGSAVVNFAIEGDMARRFAAFLDNCWISHGIFYSVIRTDVLRGCAVLGEAFFGFDWAVDLYLASRGGINRTASGLMILGGTGISNNAMPWRRYRTHIISWVVPFHRVSLYALKLSAGLPWAQRLLLVMRLIGLNLLTARVQLQMEMQALYASYFGPRLRVSGRGQ